MRDIVFLSLENWDDLWRRNQFVCDELARRFPATRILFVGLPINVSNQLRRGRLPEPPPPVDTGRDNIVVTSPVKWFPDSLAVGRLFNRILYRRHLRSQIRRLRFDRPILWINAHWAGHVVGRLGESAVIYDITDDWTRLTQSNAERNRVIQQDAALLETADAVVVCSQRLLEIKTSPSRSTHLIPNGVNLDHYQSVTEHTAEWPAGARDWPRPVYGYTGTIHPDRVNIDLVVQVAGQLQDRHAGTMVFVGPTDLSTEQMRRLTAGGNVVVVGAVAYRDIPMYMRAFDVCIVPHVVSDFTDSLNPIKLWEYLAGGKPIVSTPVAGFRDYPDVIKLAETPEEFVRQMVAAAAEPNLKVDDRKRLAAGASWASRVDEIVQVIEAATAAADRGQ